MMKKIFIKRMGMWSPALLLLGLTSCFDDGNSVKEEYADWNARNLAYIEAKADSMAGGQLYFTRLTPDWAPNAYALVHWHNNRLLTANNLQPMDNSTVQITYELFDIDGKRLSDSFSMPDSIYTSKPSNNIIGVWYPLTQMHVGDSVTIIMPNQSGYGSRKYGEIQPYSTLIYNIKLKGIAAYEIKP